MGPRVRVIVFIRASQLAKGKALTGRHFGGQVPEGIRGGGENTSGRLCASSESLLCRLRVKHYFSRASAILLPFTPLMG